MRSSSPTFWLRAKVRFITAGLIFSLGFYFGLTHRVFTQAFWPGTAASAGFCLFLAICVSIGLTLPASRPSPLPLLNNLSPEHRWPLILKIRVALTLLTGAVLIAVVFGALLTRWLVSLAPVLSQRFLLIPASWNLLVFLFPLPALALAGLVLGMMLDLVFLAFVYLACPAHLRSDLPPVTNTLCSVICWTLSALSIGWLCGSILVLPFLDRWLVLMLVPVIAILAVLLTAFWEAPGEGAWLAQIQGQAGHFPVSSPERAGRTNRWAGLAVALLGGLAIWNISHWSFVLVNWLSTDRLGLLQSFSLPAVLSSVSTAGIVLGYRYARGKPHPYLTDVDRQGYAMVFLGIALILAAIAVRYAATAPHVLICWLPGIGLALLWGVNLGLTLPTLAIGRPNRFDLWMELSGKLTFGALVAVPLVWLWQVAGIGCLLAIDLGALAAMTFGGAAILYQQPQNAPTRRYVRMERYLYLSCLVILYAGLAFTALTIPHLKSSWLAPPGDSELELRENAAGVASLTRNEPRQLLWSGIIAFPERTSPRLRDESVRIVREIFRLTAERLGEKPFALTLGLPFISRTVAATLPLRRIDQFDYDKSLRNLEYKLLEREHPEPIRAIDDLYCSRWSYPTLIVRIPHPWPCTPAWPSPRFLMRQLFAFCQSPYSLWFICPVPIASHQTPVNLLNNHTDRDFSVIAIQGNAGYRWYIAGHCRQLQSFDHNLLLEKDAGIVTAQPQADRDEAGTGHTR